MQRNIPKNFWFHMVLWIFMLVYFFVAPDVLTALFVKNGKPLHTHNPLPEESDRISFAAEDLVSYTKDGERLYNLYGWAFIVPDGNMTNAFVKEIVLFSENQRYYFPVQSTYRDPGPKSLVADEGVDLNTLGFSALLAEDAIKPGKYRIGIIFRDSVTGAAVYSDKPARHIVKTANTIRFEKN
jgi:hypothetical protein